jgi:hypothetical protein
LLHLSGLNGVAVIDISGSAVTQAGVGRLRASLPLCEIKYDASTE